MWAFVHGTVIDTVTGASRPDSTVLVDGDVITEVGPSSQVAVPDDASIVDVTGRYLVPGLADMHVHSGTDDRIDPPLQVANGITLVREMWGSPRTHDWRRRVEAGTLLGPRWVIGSKLVDGHPSLWSDMPIDPDTLVEVDTPDQARRAVAEAKEGDADFVKVYSRVPAEAYRALLDEAGRRDIPVMGHRPDAVRLTETIDLGQRSLEHLHALWPATSRNADDLEAAMARIAPRVVRGMRYSDWFRQLNEVEWDAYHTSSPYAAQAVFDRMVAQDVAYTPTLVMHRTLDDPGSARPNDPRMRYVPADLVGFWSTVVDQIYTADRSVDEAAKRLLLFESRLRTVGAMADAGVRILAGTDLGTGFLYPGFSLHEELELLVRAGLSPLRALRAATVEPARVLGREHNSGSIRPDNVADLVILDGDPLTDIRNTQRIHAVLTRGRYLGPDDRRRVLDEVAAAAAESAEAGGASVAEADTK